MKKLRKELLAVLIVGGILISMSIYEHDTKMLITSGVVVAVMATIIMINSKD